MVNNLTSIYITKHTENHTLKQRAAMVMSRKWYIAKSHRYTIHSRCCMSSCVYIAVLERFDVKRGRTSRPKSAGSIRTPRSRSSEPVSLPAYTEDIYRDKYQPESFTGQHVSDTINENQSLKQQVRYTENQTLKQKTHWKPQS